MNLSLHATDEQKCCSSSCRAAPEGLLCLFGCPYIDDGMYHLSTSLEKTPSIDPSIYPSRGSSSSLSWLVHIWSFCFAFDENNRRRHTHTHRWVSRDCSTRNVKIVWNVAGILISNLATIRRQPNDDIILNDWTSVDISFWKIEKELMSRKVSCCNEYYRLDLARLLRLKCWKLTSGGQWKRVPETHFYDDDPFFFYFYFLQSFLVDML